MVNRGKYGIMTSMIPKITNEQRKALHSSQSGRPVQVEDGQDQRVYWLVAPEDVSSLWSNYVRAEVDRGVKAIDQGEVVDWNPERMKELARAAAANHSQSN